MTITPVFRVSFPAVFTAETNKLYPANLPRYSVDMIFSEETMKMTDQVRKTNKGWGHLDEFKKLIEECLEKRTPGRKIAKDFTMPIFDGKFNKDGSERTYDGYGPGTFYCKTSCPAKSKAGADNKPGVVDRDKSHITDPSQFYAGCYAMASVNLYLFPFEDALPIKGISVSLKNLQKVAEGDTFSGRTKPSQDFAAIEVPELELNTFDLDL